MSKFIKNNRKIEIEILKVIKGKVFKIIRFKIQFFMMSNYCCFDTKSLQSDPAFSH